MPIAQRHFNQLSEAEAERLALLLEELGECQQIIGKILRHGYESHHPDRPALSNRRLLEDELGHVLLAAGMMAETGDLDAEHWFEAAEGKAIRVGKYLHHCGVPSSLIGQIREAAQPEGEKGGSRG